MNLTWTMTKTFLKIFSRDRQAIFFTLFFPIIFMTVFGFASNNGEEPLAIGIIDNANNSLSTAFIETVNANPMFAVTVGNESDLRELVVSSDLKVVLTLPPGFQDNGIPADLTLLVDAAQVRELGVIMPLLEQALVDIERSLRNTEPLFSLTVEDIKARSQSYLDFLVPGLLAFTIMQISIAGSGYNIVEFRRKGILKRLFVTPIEPANFIGGLVISRSIICLVQLSALLAIAVLIFKVTISGGIPSLLVIILLGTALFLSIGFCLGSIAKTQQSIMAIGNLITFPQMFLSGIFYPIDRLPELIQPVAQLLPLSYLSSALRSVVVDAATLADILPELTGLAVWSIVALVLAIRLFEWKEVAT